MKTACIRGLVTVLGLCAVLGNVHAADQMQTVTINVPVEINWPQADVAQAFLSGPPFLKCNLYNVAVDNDMMKWLALSKPIASGSQPLMIDASGHYSGNVAISFSVPAGTSFPKGGGTYWCFLGTRNAKLADLGSLAQQRGLKVDGDSSSNAATFKTK